MDHPIMCTQCRMTFRQVPPPKDDPSHELVRCSDCDVVFDIWDEGDVSVASIPTKISDIGPRLFCKEQRS
jgi:hypothetical protein